MGKHELQTLIEELHGKYAQLNDGNVATYIPELGKADPNDFGICIVTSDGRVFEAGTCDRTFTIQSISKPFTFGMALEELGHQHVFQRVGVEPSGEPFNSIELQAGTNRPFNPMVNAGAITVTALLHARHGREAFDRILSKFSCAAGRQLTIDEAVYASESSTGHRNRAIAYLLLNFGMMHGEAEQALEVYFKQCSILVSCRDLATMAATVSNLGRNPITHDAAFDHRSVKDMLSIMFTCGMYDYSGHWAYQVGVPAKSGVSGGLIAVVNRQLGVATYSPRLDTHGNSVRGIGVFAELASQLGLHAFDLMNSGSSFLDAIL
jgi:glutaminase